MTTLTIDRVLTPREQRLQDRLRFGRARQAESGYAAQLRQVARVVGEIVRGFAPTGTLEDFFQLRQMLMAYGELLTPWARAVAGRMLGEVARKDAQAWAQHGQRMGRALAKEIAQAPTGEVLRRMMNEQVSLITSLPREAAERVHRLTLEGISRGTRADSVAKEILYTGHVTRSRANLIARTEVARTTTNLTAARAKFVGSEMFIWRTAGDTDVRRLHRQLEGKAFRWDDPPVAGEHGEHALPGNIYNCRCVPEPIIPDLI